MQADLKTADSAYGAGSTACLAVIYSAAAAGVHFMAGEWPFREPQTVRFARLVACMCIWEHFNHQSDELRCELAASC